MISQLSKRIELKFWDIMIPLLSNSSRLRVIVQKLVDLYHEEKIVKQTATVVVIACAGFASGFLIFSLTTLFS